MYRRIPVLFAALPTTGRYTKTCSANYFGQIGLTGFEPATSWSRNALVIPFIRSKQLVYKHFLADRPSCVKAYSLHGNTWICEKSRPNCEKL